MYFFPLKIMDWGNFPNVKKVLKFENQKNEHIAALYTLYIHYVKMKIAY